MSDNPQDNSDGKNGYRKKTTHLFKKETAVSVAGEEALSADSNVVEAAVDERAQLSAEIERIRKTRKPFGSLTQKLVIAERRGYHRHWFNDSPGRVDKAKESGWTHVTDPEGKPVKRVVGSDRGGALYAFAMELPQIFWDEDMQAQFERAQGPVDAIKRSPFRAKAGESQASDREKFYSPRDDEILKINR